MPAAAFVLVRVLQPGALPRHRPCRHRRRDQRGRLGEHGAALGRAAAARSLPGGQKAALPPAARGRGGGTAPPLSTRWGFAPFREVPAGAAGQYFSLSTRWSLTPLRGTLFVIDPMGSCAAGSREAGALVLSASRTPLGIGAGYAPFGPRRRFFYVMAAFSIPAACRRPCAGPQGLSGKKSVSAFRPGDGAAGAGRGGA